MKSILDWLGVNKLLLVVSLLLVGIVSWEIWRISHDKAQQAVGYQKCESAVSVPKEIGELEDKLATAKATITALQAQETERNELREIPARRITRPIWVCAADSVPQPSAGQGGSDGGAISGAGPTVERPREDVRPGIEAFKARYETVIAHARAALAQCPNVVIEPLEEISP